jgi:hypothetical protein
MVASPVNWALCATAMPALSEEYRQGVRSFHTNLGAFVCPYGRGSDQYNCFERGWKRGLYSGAPLEIARLEQQKIADEKALEEKRLAGMSQRKREYERAKNGST